MHAEKLNVYGQGAARFGRVLSLLFRDIPLKKVLSEIINIIQLEKPDMIGSILLLSEDGTSLLEGAAPNLPAVYVRAVNGVKIGESVGSCGTAAALKERVIVEDIETHPYWSDFKELALSFNLKACWSQPIFAANHHVLGTFAMYYKEKMAPDEEDLKLIEDASHLTKMAIEKYQLIREEDDTNNFFSSEFALVITDLTNKVIFVNPAFESLVGNSAPDCISQSIFKLLKFNTLTQDNNSFNLANLNPFRISTGSIKLNHPQDGDIDLAIAVGTIVDVKQKIESRVWLFGRISDQLKSGDDLGKHLNCLIG